MGRNRICIYEIIQRLRETALRLETIEHAELNAARDKASNSDFIPYVALIEADIRLTRQALAAIDDENVSDSTLSEWLDTFTHLTGKIHWTRRRPVRHFR